MDPPPWWPPTIVSTPVNSTPVNLPNLISLCRLLSVPLLVWLILDNQMELAFWLFIAAGISDAVDGYIAKQFDIRSVLGSYLDPLADKALLTSVYIVLGSQSFLPNWLVILVVFRDIMIVGGALLFYTLTQTLKMAPLLISKVNTVVQIVLAGVVLGIAAMDVPEGSLPLLQIYLTWALIYLVAATTLLSGASYLVKWSRKAATMEDVR